MNKLVVSSLLGTMVLAACFKTVPLEDRPCPCTSGWTCCANVCVEGTTCPSTPAGGFAASAVSVAKNACNGTSGGALEKATSAADATSKLGKAWMSCDRHRWLEDRGGDAIAFSNDGTWALFKLDATGALAPMAGLGSHGTWTVYGTGSSSPLDRTDTSANEITVIGFEDQGSTSGVPETALLEFEPNAARMRFFRPSGSPPEESWFAPVQGAWDPTVGCGSACGPSSGNEAAGDASASE